jgi:hypothetical protein
MKHVLSKAGLWITLATIAIAGCTTLNQDEEDAPLLRAINRSDEVLQDVMIRNVDSHPQHFGIVGQGPAGEKTLQVQIRFDKAFVIGWHANGSHGARQLDLSKY